MKRFFVASVVLAGALSAINVHAAAINASDVVVVRIGDGSTAITNTTAAVFLDEYTQGGTFVQSIPMPTSASGPSLALTMLGNGTAEGDLTVSPDGSYLALTGFNFGTGVISPATTNSSVVARSVGIVATVDGSVDTTTAINNQGASDPRGAITTDGNSIWQVNSGNGMSYTTLGNTGGTQLYTTLNNSRRVAISQGQLYFSDASGSAFRLGTVGTGLPTTSGQTLVNLPGFPTTGTVNGAQPYSFVFLSEGGGTGNVLYVTDAANAFQPTGTGGVEKWSLVGGTWVNNGFISAPGISNNVSGISGFVDGSGNAHVYFTAGGGSVAVGPGGPGNSQTNLDLYVDTAGYNAATAGSITTIAMAGNNEVFRGVVVLPEPSTYALVGAGLLGLLTLRRRRS